MRKKRMNREDRKAAWGQYTGLSLMALAAMVTARLVLLAVDVAQSHVDQVGIVIVPACGVILFLTGWKFREWTMPGERSPRKGASLL